MSNKTTSKSKTTRSKRLLFLKKHPILYSILGAIVAFILVSGVIVPIYQKVTLKLEISRDTRASLKTYNDYISKGYNYEIALEKRMMHMDSAPVYSVVYNGCHKDTVDAGWMVSSYYYSCQLNYVNFFDIPPAAESYIASIAAPFEAKADPYGNGYIDEYQKAIGVEVRKTNWTYSLSLLGSSDASTVISKHAPDIPSYYEKRETLHESGSPKLDPTKRYIFLYSTDSYYYKNLGCAHPKFVFCSSPI